MYKTNNTHGGVIVASIVCMSHIHRAAQDKKGEYVNEGSGTQGEKEAGRGRGRGEGEGRGILRVERVWFKRCPIPKGGRNP